MSFSRDFKIKLAVRKTNLLRLEYYKRVKSEKVETSKIFIKSLIRDDGLELANKSILKQKLHTYSTWERVTKHRSRCWTSGRARQVQRSSLLSRMHLRSHMSEGLLPTLQLRRR